MDIMKNKLKCPICDHVASYYKKLREITLYYCDHCKHRFTDIESIKNKETYSENYFKEKHPKWFELNKDTNRDTITTKCISKLIL